ncbi:hypothetical protein Lal_00018367 [Lupinus albus]|nr:hypothetical protein Lal_00018367 [Lupinus albus]
MDFHVMLNMAGRGMSQNVPNDLLIQMVAALQQMNENLRNLNQKPAPSPSSQPLVPPKPTKYRGNGADLQGHELFRGSEVDLCHLYASDRGRELVGVYSTPNGDGRTIDFLEYIQGEIPS